MRLIQGRCSHKRSRARRRACQRVSVLTNIREPVRAVALLWKSASKRHGRLHVLSRMFTRDILTTFRPHHVPVPPVSSRPESGGKAVGVRGAMGAVELNEQAWYGGRPARQGMRESPVGGGAVAGGSAAGRPPTTSPYSWPPHYTGRRGGSRGSGRRE